MADEFKPQPDSDELTGPQDVSDNYNYDDFKCMAPLDMSTVQETDTQLVMYDPDHPLDPASALGQTHLFCDVDATAPESHITIYCYNNSQVYRYNTLYWTGRSRQIGPFWWLAVGCNEFSRSEEYRFYYETQYYQRGVRFKRPQTPLPECPPGHYWKKSSSMELPELGPWGRGGDFHNQYRNSASYTQVTTRYGAYFVRETKSEIRKNGSLNIEDYR